MVRRLVLAVGLAVSAACTFPEEPLPAPARLLVVHAVLDPSRREQVVSLGASDGARLQPGELDSAIVVITTPDGTAMRGRQDTAYTSYPGVTYRPPVYRIDLEAYAVNLVPGGTYQLRITTVAGDEVSGTTTIPEAAGAIVAQAPEFVRQRDTLRMTWPTIPLARTYEIQLWTRGPYNPPDVRYLTYARFTTGDVRIAGTATSFGDEPLFEPESNVIAQVCAVDVNYYEYYRTLGDPFVGAPPSRLTGALGVFGSMVPIIRRQFDVR